MFLNVGRFGCHHMSCFFVFLAPRAQKAASTNNFRSKVKTLWSLDPARPEENRSINWAWRLAIFELVYGSKAEERYTLHFSRLQIHVLPGHWKSESILAMFPYPESRENQSRRGCASCCYFLQFESSFLPSIRSFSSPLMMGLLGPVGKETSNQ